VDTLLLLLGATPAAEAWSLEAEVAGEEGVEEEGESVTDLDRSRVDAFCKNLGSLEDGEEERDGECRLPVIAAHDGRVCPTGGTMFGGERERRWEGGRVGSVGGVGRCSCESKVFFFDLDYQLLLLFNPTTRPLYVFFGRLYPYTNHSMIT
jgi:hypothetical protein